MARFKSGMLSLICALVLVSGFSGCASTRTYKTSILKFQTASAVVIDNSRSYLSEVNKTARDAYIEDCVRNRESIRLDKLYDAQPLSSEALSLRLATLDDLTRYGELLYDLASSNAPEEVQAGFQELGASLKKINDDVIKDPGESGKGFGQCIGPVSEIFGVIAKDLMERKIQAALDKAVEAGKGPVLQLIVAMRDDVVVAYAQKQDFYSQRRVLLVDQYNEALKKNEGESVLKAKAENLKAGLTLYEALLSADPREGFDAMIRAHEALVKYAQSSKQPEDLAAFAEAMDDFVSSAKIIAGAVSELKKIKT
ncbi:MAG: hypothetical protein WC484_05740 [Candidatus Omnitrophota bacterium]